MLTHQSADAAHDVYTCPNVQVGGEGAPGFTYPSVYSDCYMDFVTDGFAIPRMTYASGDISLDANYREEFSPQPSYTIKVGTYTATATSYAFENMGSGYSGNCVNDMNNTTSLLVGVLTATQYDVYCGRLTSGTGESVWLRATFDGWAFTSPLIVTNAASAAPPSVPVPTLPLFGLLSLGGLIGLFGTRKLKR
jgi:hypothetical protein